MITKFESIILGTKAACFIIVGVATPLGVSLAQYANTGEWPSKIVWWGVVIPACSVGGATQLISFLNNSFHEYSAKRNNGNTAIITKPPTP